MAEIMLVNPRARARKRRTPAQKAATRKMVAANKRRKSPARRTYATNPAPARRRAVARPSPARSIVRKRRFKRNPTARGIIESTLKPAAVAAVGALSLDVLWGFAPVPEMLKTGPFRHVAKGIGALGLGYIAGMVVDKRMAAQMATGAMTVVMHDAFKEVAARVMPGVPLGYYSAGYPAGAMGAYVDGMGAYVGGDAPSPYLSKDNLSQPFAGPSAANVAFSKGVTAGANLETEQNMGNWY